MFQHFSPCKKSDIAARVRLRSGETKLGELIKVPDDASLVSFLQETSAHFVVLGIAEDVGVLANGGNAGTAAAWDFFLSSFLNIQANDFTKADTIAVLGHFSFDELKQKIEKEAASPEERTEEYRKTVPIIDDAVSELIQAIVAGGKIPIVVGGGHNNSYPIIKGTALGLASSSDVKGINCINLDAHIDYRLAEGRHSGNGFRYAKQEGYLMKYFALGIHENYIPNGILKEVSETADVDFITFEDIFIQEKKTWHQALEDAGIFIGVGSYTGMELDLDSIAHVPASAATPCGITSREALQYVAQMTAHFEVPYLHICEGMASVDNPMVGKLISYLVTSFVKGYHKKIKPERSNQP